MASILLIEQQRIVREAIRHFLFPDHEVVVSEAWPTSEELVGHAAMIIDTATLLQMGLNLKEAEAGLARAKLPGLWLCSEDTELPASKTNCNFVRKPLEAKVFASALRDLLGVQLGARGTNAATGDPDGIVELTDIIEEDLPEKETN